MKFVNPLEVVKVTILMAAGRRDGSNGNRSEAAWSAPVKETEARWKPLDLQTRFVVNPIGKLKYATYLLVEIPAGENPKS